MRSIYHNLSILILLFISQNLFAQNPNPKGITIITHGFQPLGSFDSYWYDFAAAIKMRAGNGATIYTNDIQTGQWVKLPNSAFSSNQYGGNGNGDSNEEIIFVVNWAQRSNDIDGGLENAADELFAILSDTPNELEFNSGGIWSSTKPIHMIGHSRGAIFNLQLCHRVLKYFPSRLIAHFTTLDPHPAYGFGLYNDVNSQGNSLPGVNGYPQYNSVTIALPNNIIKGDNYFRRIGEYESLNISDLDFDGVDNFSVGNYNRELNNEILKNGPNPIAHSNVHYWYLATIDMGKPVPNNYFSRNNGELDIAKQPKLNESRDSTAFFYSRLGGGYNILPEVTNTINLSNLESSIAQRSYGKRNGLLKIFNGDFENDYNGWYVERNNNLLSGSIQLNDGNKFLKIGAGDNNLHYHNWLYFQPNTDYLTFKAKANQNFSVLGVKFYDGAWTQLSSTQLIINPTTEFKDYFVTIPPALRGKTGTFKLEWLSNNSSSEISIDDIDLTNNAPTPTASITALGETTFCNASQTVQLKASTTNPDYEYQWQKNGSNIAAATDSIYTVNIEGDYSLKVTSKSTGLFAISDSVKVSYKELTEYTVGGGGIVQEGDAIALEAKGGDYYLWEGPNGFVSNVQYPVRYNATASMSGNYSVTITAQSGCSATANVSVNVTPVSENSSNCPPLLIKPQPFLNKTIYTYKFSKNQSYFTLWNFGTPNYFISKYDSLNNLLWSKDIGPLFIPIYDHRVISTFDGGVILADEGNNSYYKLNEIGEYQWQNFKPEYKTTYTQYTNGELVYQNVQDLNIANINPSLRTLSNSNELLILSSLSKVESRSFLGTNGVFYEYLYNPENTSFSHILWKVNSVGGVNKAFLNLNFHPSKIQICSDGNLLLIGGDENAQTNIAKINLSGEILWQKGLDILFKANKVLICEAGNGDFLVHFYFQYSGYDNTNILFTNNGVLLGNSKPSVGYKTIISDFDGNYLIGTDLGGKVKLDHYGNIVYQGISQRGDLYSNEGRKFLIDNSLKYEISLFTSAILNGLTEDGICYNERINLNAGIPLITQNSTSYKWFRDTYLDGVNFTLSNRSFGENGAYHLKIENGSGCSVVTPPVTIITPKISSNAIYVYNTDVNGNKSTSNGLCEGATLNLSAEGGDTYAWTGPNGFVSNLQNPSIPNITTANGGIYYCRITNDKRNCNVTLSTEVKVLGHPIVNMYFNNNSGLSTTIEEGENLGITRTYDFTNPTNPYTWTITGPNGFIAKDQWNSQINNVSLSNGGTYILTSKQGNCTSVVSEEITVTSCPLNPIISYSFQNSSNSGSLSGILSSTNSNSFCIKPNTEVGLSARGSSSNSDIYGYNYQWYRFGVPIANATNSYIYISQSGTYSVKVSRYGRCEKVSPNYIINVNFEPEFTTNILTPKPICQGQGFTFQASPQTNSYTWTGPDNFTANGHTIAVTNVQPVLSGQYFIKATNNAGCSLTKQSYFQVEENPKPYNVNYALFSSNILIEGVPFGLQSDFQNYYRYIWEGPNNYFFVTNRPNNSNFPISSVSLSGNYKLTVETVNGCQRSVTKEIEIKKIKIQSNKQIICKNDVVRLTGDFCDGIILWSNGDSTIIVDNQWRYTDAGLNVRLQNTTTYTARCKVGNFIGTISEPITITVYPDPPKPIIGADDYSVCYPDVVTLRSAGCSFQTSWGPYNSTVTDSVLNLNLGEGTYKLAFSCISENGCSSELVSDSITVNVYNKPSTPSIEGIPLSSYPAGQEVTLVANHYGSPTDTLIWSNGIRGNSITVRPIITTTYSVYAKNAGGCISDVSQPVIITINGALPLTIQANTYEVCAGSSINLSATGCSGSVLWSTGQSGLSISTTINTTTIYTASCLLNGSNVSISNELTINVVSRLPTPQIQANKAAIGEGESVTLTAQGCTNTIKWSNGDTGNTITVFPSNNSSYRAICTYDAFCESDSSNRIDILVTPFIDCNFFQNVRVEIRKSDYWEYENNKIPQGTTVTIIGDIVNPDFNHLPIKWLVKNLANEIIDSISNTKQITVKCSQSITVFASIRSGQCENVSSLNLSIDDTDNIGCFDLNGNALDGSERNVDGQIIGNVLPTTDRFNNPNSALYFPGNMYSWVKVLPPLAVQPSFTINTWVYREEGSSFYVLGQGRKDYLTGWFGLLCGDGGSLKPGFGVKYGSHNPEIAYAYSDESLQNNRWYMLTGVVDAINHKIKFYVNGSLKSEVEYPFENSLRTFYGLPFSIGRNTAHAYDLENYGTWETYPFKGKVDDVCIRNIALTDFEVKALFDLSNCEETVSLLGQNYLNGLNVVRIKAAKEISSNSLIQNSNVEFRAGNSINLLPGFKVVQGAVFKASIKGCGDN